MDTTIRVAILLIVIIISVIISFSTASRVNIDLNYDEMKEQSRKATGVASPASLPKVSIANSHTGTKVHGTGHTASTLITSDNLQRVEKLTDKKKFFKKGEIVTDTGSSAHPNQAAVNHNYKGIKV